MRLDELKITQSGLARARSQEMRNTLALIAREYAKRGFADRAMGTALFQGLQKPASGN